MKNHAWRPFYLAVAAVALLLLVRAFMVPSDFGVYERGYMYGWHRVGNEKEWRATPVKYRTSAFCTGCHRREAMALAASPHGNIACENCHGPALNHPTDPPTLTVDRSRSLCLRCHARLPYPGSDRGKIRGINPATHYPEAECSLCHYPHDPRREASR